jgi:hypothetical protein
MKERPRYDGDQVLQSGNRHLSLRFSTAPWDDDGPPVEGAPGHPASAFVAESERFRRISRRPVSESFGRPLNSRRPVSERLRMDPILEISRRPVSTSLTGP